MVYLNEEKVNWSYEESRMSEEPLEDYLLGYKVWFDSLGYPKKEFYSKSYQRTYFEQYASQEEFLAWYKMQDLPTYPKPSLTVDFVAVYSGVVNGEEGDHFIFIRRKANPFRGKLAFAGGFVDEGEDAKTALIREVKEELGISINPDRLFEERAVTTPGRDPRGWSVTIPFVYSFTEEEFNSIKAGDDAKEVVAVLHKDLISSGGASGLRHLKGQLAFDHEDILMSSIPTLDLANRTWLNILLRGFEH